MLAALVSFAGAAPAVIGLALNFLRACPATCHRIIWFASPDMLSRVQENTPR
ncbi:MAG: hypothetical protein V4516_00925 [Pseudomonadota bacterium]